jgi:hypothetical protein
MSRVSRLLSVCLIAFLIPYTATAGIFSRGGDFKVPTPEELSMTAVPFAPGAPAVLLEWIARHDDEVSEASEHVRIKILTAEGKKYGDIALPFVPGYSTVHGVKARVIKPDGTVVPFEGKMHDKLVIKAGGVKLMEKTFSLPDVQPGSIVEYRYSRGWPSTELMTNRWTLQREIPIMRTQIWVKPYGVGVSSLFSTKNLPASAAPKKVGDHFEVELVDTPAFEEEPFAPPSEELKPSVEFFYTAGKHEPEKFWKETGRVWTDSIEQFIGDRRPQVAKILAEATLGETAPEAKLRKLYTRVQQVRNLSFEDDKTAQEVKREKLRDNRNVDDVARNNYGYRNEINRLFVALARSAGFQANIVCVSQRDESFFQKNVPNARQIFGEVAVVSLNGTDKYFDPGTPHAPFGLLSWVNTGVVAMRVQKKSDAAWVQTVEQPTDAAVTSRKGEFELVDDMLKGKVTVTFAGQEALVRRLRMHLDDEQNARKKVEDEVKGWFPDGSTAKLTTVSSTNSSDHTLEAQFDVEVANLATAAGSRSLLPLAVFTAPQKNPFSAEHRKHPMYFPYRYTVEDEVTVRLPEGHAVETLPKNVAVDLGGAGYTTTWSSAPGSVALKRKMFLDTTLIDQPLYKTIRTFFSEVARGDQANAVIRKAGK